LSIVIHSRNQTYCHFYSTPTRIISVPHSEFETFYKIDTFNCLLESELTHGFTLFYPQPSIPHNH